MTERLLCEGCEWDRTDYVCPHDRALCAQCARDDMCRECRTDPERWDA